MSSHIHASWRSTSLPSTINSTSPSSWLSHNWPGMMVWLWLKPYGHFLVLVDLRWHVVVWSFSSRTSPNSWVLCPFATAWLWARSLQLATFGFENVKPKEQYGNKVKNGPSLELESSSKCLFKPLKLYRCTLKTRSRIFACIVLHSSLARYQQWLCRALLVHATGYS